MVCIKIVMQFQSSANAISYKDWDYRQSIKTNMQERFQSSANAISYKAVQDGVVCISQAESFNPLRMQ